MIIWCRLGTTRRSGGTCVIVGQVGISGSCELGDFVIVGGQVGIADHVRIGDGARLAARAGVVGVILPGGQDYGGMPAKPVREWAREMAAVTMLAKTRQEEDDDGQDSMREFRWTWSRSRSCCRIARRFCSSSG